MKILRTPQELISWRKEQNLTIGFVPTMGALHEGHATLIRKARAENAIVVLSIFVNPTQFNDPKDFAKYPSTWDADLKIAGDNDVDVLFAPSKDMMYPDGYRFKVVENEFSLLLCGKDRPGHFDGVLSIVMKLFNIVRPQKAYFGEKDFQQLRLIQDMVTSFFMSLQVVPVPTVREVSGLAMSSRNQRLSAEEKNKTAPQIYKRISESVSADQAKVLLKEDGFDVDYVVDNSGRRFVAAKLGEVRLIDNVKI